MHITLVRPPLVSSKLSVNAVAVPPIGLAYLAGACRQAGYEVLVVDAISEGIGQFHEAHTERHRFD